MSLNSRRHFLKTAGAGAAVMPFLTGLPELRGAEFDPQKVQRVVIMFSPNGVVQKNYWPKTQGKDFEITPIIEPLKSFRDRMLVVKGIANDVRGDGDSHMRGMSCLLTGDELLPGNIQGGDHTPAGWANSISIDQEIKNFLQSRQSSKTRFGSIEFGVAVPNRADPWTRMCYAGSNQPLAPDSDPYSVFSKMYGRSQDDTLVRSVLDDVQGQLKTFQRTLSVESRQMLDRHQTFVAQMENDMRQAAEQKLSCAAPELEDGVRVVESNTPKISRMQIDLLVNGFANDMNRVATLQYSNSVGQLRMKWIGVEEPHHQLSHDPDIREASQEKLTRINKWFAGEMNYLLSQLDATPDPVGEGSLLDNTLVIWTNELGKGNIHSLKNLPMLMVGNAQGFRTGRFLDVKDQHHNRLWLSLSHAFGHNLKTFGHPWLCRQGPLTDLG